MLTKVNHNLHYRTSKVKKKQYCQEISCDTFHPDQNFHFPGKPRQLNDSKHIMKETAINGVDLSPFLLIFSIKDLTPVHFKIGEEVLCNEIANDVT